MTTSILVPFLPGVGAGRAALILEKLEAEVRASGALFGLLIDRAGQVLAADAPKARASRRRLVILTAHLVPIVLASRSVPPAERLRAACAPLMEHEGLHLITQPILDEWLLAMAFPSDALPPDLDAHLGRWLATLIPLVPARGKGQNRRARRTIARDGIGLLFRDDDDEAGTVQGGTERWR
jgi:hypothetical protein